MESNKISNQFPPELLEQIKAAMPVIGHQYIYHEQFKFAYLLSNNRTNSIKWNGVFLEKSLRLDNLPPDKTIHEHKDKPNLYFLIMDDTDHYEGYIYFVDLPNNFNYFLVLTGRLKAKSKLYKDKVAFLDRINEQRIEFAKKHPHKHDEDNNRNTAQGNEEEEENREEEEENEERGKNSRIVRIEEPKRPNPKKR